MRRLLPLALLLAALAGCGDDKTKTVTETRTVTVTKTTPAAPADDKTAILDAAEAFYAASADNSVKRSDLSIVKNDDRFADVLVAGEAHAILKKGGDTWVVVFDGNGAIPQEIRDRFGIPPEYGG